MSEEEFSNLIQKYLAGEASAKEVKQVDDWYDSFEKGKGVTSGMDADTLQSAISNSFESLQARLQQPA